MQDQEVSVTNKKQLFVTLKEKTDELEEVTIVAFAKQKKRECTSFYYDSKTIGIKGPEQ